MSSPPPPPPPGSLLQAVPFAMWHLSEKLTLCPTRHGGARCACWRIGTWSTCSKEFVIHSRTMPGTMRGLALTQMHNTVQLMCAGHASGANSGAAFGGLAIDEPKPLFGAASNSTSSVGKPATTGQPNFGESVHASVHGLYSEVRQTKLCVCTNVCFFRQVTRWESCAERDLRYCCPAVSYLDPHAHTFFTGIIGNPGGCRALCSSAAAAAGAH